jgi:hypothetical protein
MPALLGRWSTVRPSWLGKRLELPLWPLPRWGRVPMPALAGMTRQEREA